MNVCIVGWYGTETLGDIAILDGILKVLSNINVDVHANIGSLYPFYSERTFYEEEKIFRESAPNTHITIFNIRDSVERKTFIKTADLLLIGGGPLMDLEELFIIEDTFRIAKKYNIVSLVVGCGLGPLNNPTYIKVVKSILDMATAISFRDKYSLTLANNLNVNLEKCTYIGDPAVISIESYYKKNQKYSKDYVAVNLRSFPKAEYGGEVCVTDNILQNLLIQLAEEYGEVLLVPMHTFAIGGDDRFYLTELTEGFRDNRIKVIHKPQNLLELYECFRNAKMCVGMRYHSVVMQTILNGNNYILDYTDSKHGKIQGFIQELEGKEFYSDRVFSLTDFNTSLSFNEFLSCHNWNSVYKYHCSEMESNYVEFIKSKIQ